MPKGDRINWNEVMIKNSAYVVYGKKLFPKNAKQIVIPDDVDKLRKRRPRPKRFRL
jgi:hypothetical protein